MLIELKIFTNGDKVCKQYHNLSEFFDNNSNFNDRLRENIKNTGWSYLSDNSLLIDTEHKSDDDYFDRLKNDAISINRELKLKNILEKSLDK